MSENLFENYDRIRINGEVFTPLKTVNFMLNQPEISEKISILNSTFLEPSAGKGIFLVEILKRRIKIASMSSNNFNEFNINSLISLSTLYGIEFLDDNVKDLISNMSNIFIKYYTKFSFCKYNFSPIEEVIKSAKTIINANMVQGDTINKIKSDGTPIIFSEWKTVTDDDTKVQRREYTFEYIINKKDEQLDLFSLDYDGFDNKQIKEYIPVKWLNLYKQILK